MQIHPRRAQSLAHHASSPVAGWKSGFARWMMEARWIDQKYDRMGDMMECKL